MSLDLYDVYCVGESEEMPKLSHIKPDIVLLPFDGYGRLSATLGLELLESLKPRWAIPYNWGVGEKATRLGAHNFKNRASSDTEIILLPISP